MVYRLLRALYLSYCRAVEGLPEKLEQELEGKKQDAKEKLYSLVSTKEAELKEKK